MRNMLYVKYIQRDMQVNNMSIMNYDIFILTRTNLLTNK